MYKKNSNNIRISYKIIFYRGVFPVEIIKIKSIFTRITFNSINNLSIFPFKKKQFKHFMNLNNTFYIYFCTYFYF